ncbi:MAG: sulfotransferase family protein [Pelagimonas sp.]|jgi:hypothetical protein|nr:sulfotransferase family protein [Pelagimonas sp.]
MTVYPSQTQVKLINLGLPKSGTTTLARALREAGWRVADHRLRDADGRVLELDRTYVAQRLYDAYFANEPVLERLAGYEALTEISMLNGPHSLWPQSDYPMLKAFRACPDLRFTATWRPAPDIVDSMMRWNNLGHTRLPKGTLPGLPHGYGTSHDHLIRWVRGHYDMLVDLFADDPRFLLLDIGAPDARDLLSRHLGLDLPWWGRENANPSGGGDGGN